MTFTKKNMTTIIASLLALSVVPQTYAFRHTLQTPPLHVSPNPSESDMTMNVVMPKNGYSVRQGDYLQIQMEVPPGTRDGRVLLNGRQIWTFDVDRYSHGSTYLIHNERILENVGPAQLTITGIQDGGNVLNINRTVNITKGYLPLTVLLPLEHHNYTFGMPMRLQAKASDPNHKILVKYAGELISTLSAPDFSATWTPTESNIVQLQFTEADANGVEVDTRYINFMVDRPLNVITAHSLVLDSTAIVTGKEQTLKADTSSAVKSVEFFIDGVSVGKDLTPPYEVKWTPTKTDEMAAYQYALHVEPLSPFESVSTPEIHLFPVNEAGANFCKKIAKPWDVNTAYEPQQYVLDKTDFFVSEQWSQGIAPSSNQYLNGRPSWIRISCSDILHNKSMPNIQQVDALSGYEIGQQYTIKGKITYPETLGGKINLTKLKVKEGTANQDITISDNLAVDEEGSFQFDVVYNENLRFPIHGGVGFTNYYIEAMNDLGMEHSKGIKLRTAQE